MKEPKCEVCKLTSFIMFVSRTISLSTFQKSSMLCLPSSPPKKKSCQFYPSGQNLDHPAGCWAVSTMSRAGVPSQWALSAASMAPAKLPLYGNSHKHTHTHTYILTHMENKTKQRCTTLIEKYWTNLRHYLI